MAEETTTPETGEETETTTAPETGPAKPELTSEEQKVVDAAENPDAVRNLIQRERDARAAADKAAGEAQAKAKEYEDAQKSDQQKLSEERDTLKTDADSAKKEALRLRIAIDKKLPAEFVDRLQGTTKEELEADAEKLRAWLKDESGASTTTDFEAGAAGRTTADDKSPDSMIRQMAGRR